MTTHIRNSLGANIYIGLVYLLYMLYMITGSPWPTRIEGVIGIFVISLCFLQSEKFVRKRIIIIIMILFIIMLSNVVMTHNYGFLGVIFEISAYLTPALILNIHNINRKFSLLIFYIFAVVCTLGVVAHHNDFLAKSSINYISVMLALSILPYYSTFKDGFKRPSIIPAATCMFVCLICSGRGGILMAFFLLLGMSFNSVFLYKKTKGFHIILYIIPLIVICYLVFCTNLLEDYLYRFTMKDGGFQDLARETILEEYIYRISNSTQYLLFGFPIALSPTFNDYLNNLHNSYLMVHSYYGIIGLVLLLWCCIKSGLCLIRLERFDMLALMAAFFLRAITDWVFPFQMGSVGLYYFIVLPFINKNNIQVRKHEKSLNGRGV